MIKKFIGIAFAAVLATASESGFEYSPTETIAGVSPAQIEALDEGFMIGLRGGAPLLASTVADYYWATKCTDNQNGIAKFGKEIVTTPQFIYLLKLKDAWAKDTRSAAAAYLAMIHANRAFNCNDEDAIKRFDSDLNGFFASTSAETKHKEGK